MMRRFTTGVIVGFLMTAGPAFAQAKATTPEIPFESVSNFFKLPAGLYMGEGTGVATNSKGHVFVYVRSGESRPSLLSAGHPRTMARHWARRRARASAWAAPLTTTWRT